MKKILTKKIPAPLQIDCAGLSKKLTYELADRLTACFERVDVWGNDSISAEKPRSSDHYATAWNILDRFQIKVT